MPSYISNSRLLFLTGLLSIWTCGSAYTSGAPEPRPFVSPTKVWKTTSRTPKLRASYNLGLERNPPIVFESKDTTSCNRVNFSGCPSTAIEAVTQYWVEHEAVREYPSPHKNAALRRTVKESMDKDKKASKTKARSSRSIFPNRMTGDDVLRIHNAAQESNTHCTSTGRMDFVAADQEAVAVWQTPGRHFDLNTSWVERLIHEQQMKFASAAH
jgi:BRCT domain type II-containing protein